MTRTTIALIVCALLVACATPAPPEPTDTLSPLLLTAEELQQLGMTGGDDCRTETYETSEFSPLAEYSFCTYYIGETEVILEVKRFTNQADLNGSYQYDSSHYFGADGLLSENTFGDQSRFRINSAGDYGSEFNPPGVFFYHLWFTKETTLVHLTSKGSEDAGDYLQSAGRIILAKME